MKITYTTCRYEHQILPLLHRMSNLEHLELSFEAETTNTFIDGNNLKFDITSHMPLLKTFVFDIRSFNYVFRWKHFTFS